MTESGRFIYRPYIYENNINDFGVADSIGNLGGIIVQVFFGLAVFNSNRKKRINLIIFFCCGYIIYEVMQIFLPRGVFDRKDIIATIAGSIKVLLIFLLIHLALKHKTIYYTFKKE